MTPSTQPRYIDIFTRLSHRNTPKLCKIQHDLAVRTQHNGRIQNCVSIYTTPQKPTFISMERQLELYSLLALMCPFLRRRYRFSA